MAPEKKKKKVAVEGCPSSKGGWYGSIASMRNIVRCAGTSSLEYDSQKIDNHRVKSSSLGYYRSSSLVNEAGLYIFPPARNSARHFQ